MQEVTKLSVSDSASGYIHWFGAFRVREREREREREKEKSYNLIDALFDP